MEFIKFDISYKLLALGIHESCIDHPLFVLIDLCLAGCTHQSDVDDILLDPLWILRIILSKPVESHLHESVKVVDGIAEELDGRYMLSVSKAAVAVDSTLGGGLATLDTQLTHNGFTAGEHLVQHPSCLE